MSSQTNVIMVIADQHHAGLMGCSGHPQALTPNLDHFATEGMRFQSAYCQNPICTPSRMSVLSGQYCHNTGYYGLSGPTPKSLPSLMGHFRRHGYRTAAFGKLHLPHQGEGNWLRSDLDRLADSYENADGTLGESEFLSGLQALGLREKEDSWHNTWNYGPGSLSVDAMPSKLPYEHTQEMWCVREALQFIDETGSDRPFCMQVAFQRPHHPLLPQQEFWDMYPEDLDLPSTYDQDPSQRPPHFRAAFDAMRQQKWDFALPGESTIEGARRAWRGTLACVTQIDDVFGKLLQGLEERGMAENTIVIYHSDHGCYHGIHGIIEKAPGICSDAVCRIPMIWRGPGVQSPGSLCNALVENVDIAPTIASLCGLPPMDWVDGADLSNLLSGGLEPVHELAVTENPWSKAIRWDNWRFVHYQREMFAGEDVGELYDIESDPNETRNLYYDPAHVETVASARRLLLEWIIETTRLVTCHPAIETEEVSGLGRHCSAYAIAPDGKEINQHGPGGRLNINKNYL